MSLESHSVICGMELKMLHKGSHVGSLVQRLPCNIDSTNALSSSTFNCSSLQCSFLNSFICLSKISGILKYLREGEKWKVGQGSVSVGHGIPLSMHRRCSHEVTGTQKWGKTSNTRCPQKLALVWQPWNLHGLLIQISNLFPFQSYLRLTSLKFFQYMIIFFFLRARIRHIA